ncbi:MAG: MBL fold metallo-hydrolase [Candidatus Lokiarchaeota archaeon]|nr:MBL fold metallo-hydrolase [Candidatus Lokiarchaeota archaeon]
MEKESINYHNQTIAIQAKHQLSSSFKVRSYKEKLELMEENNIEQEPIEDVLDDFFSEHNKIISESTLRSITTIIYSKKDRIIIIESSHGKEIIWKREELVKKYGWFFFVTKQYRDKKKKKTKSGETIISEELFQIDDFEIELTEKENMRPLYKTKEYHKYLNIIKSNNITQKDIKETLVHFVSQNKAVPKKEKEAIRKIIYYEDEKVIVIKSLIGDKMYENLEHLVKTYGWYFYITGVPVGKSEISLAIDKIDKRYDSTFFEEILLSNNLKDTDKIRLTLYPIALRPNHNCIILGIGQLNILLDCGIGEEFLEDIEKYLTNLNDLLKKDQKSKIILSESQDKILEKEDNTDGNNEEDTEIQKSLSSETNHEPEELEKSENIILNVKDFQPKIDAVFLSHSHYDHVSGLKDFIKNHPDVPILCSRITLDLYLLRDSDFLKQEDHSEIEEEEYRNIVKNVIYVENGDKIEFKDKNCYLSFFHAGHMPGALMMLVKARDYRFLYSGDYTYYDITPFAGTRRFLDQISKPLDFLLIDGSNAYEEFGNPSQHFHSLILFLEQKAEYGDSSLIGADPSSLAISFMLTFWRHFRKKQLRRDYKKRPNIYVDMMVRKNIQVINHRYEYIYGPISRLIRNKANPFNSIKFRWFSHEDLDFLKKKNNIIISHPPDLSYGIIRNIINVIGRNPHNLVFLAGAVHEEPGQTLVHPPEDKKNEESIIELSETWKVPFRALLVNTFAPQIKIKLHGDKVQLTEMIKNLEPDEVCFFHESPKKLVDVAKYVTTLGVEKVSTPQERKLMILNQQL